MNDNQTRVLVGAAFYVGFVMGFKRVEKIAKRREQQLNRQIELLTVANEHFAYQLNNYHNEDITPDEFNQHVKESREFFEILKRY